MHEMSLMENLLSTAENALSEYQYNHVNSITVAAGPLANIMPDAFSFAFEALTAGGKMDGARLIIEKLPIKAFCDNCGNTYEGECIPGKCSICGASMRITGGSEVFLTGIDFEEA